MKKQLSIAALILLASFAMAFFLVAQRPEPAKRPPEPQAPLVQTAPAEARDGRLRVVASGTVRPRAEARLAPQVSGRVTYVHPDLLQGGRVARGDVLIRLDAADFSHAVEQAKAGVAERRVAVLQAEEEAALARDEYQLFQRRERRRQRDPEYGDGAPGTQILPPADLTDDSVHAHYSTDEEVGGLVFREPQRLAADAALARAEAQLANAELALERTVVRAPFTGLVRSESVELGAWVAPGQPFAELIAADVLEVVVPLTHTEAALIPELWSDSRGAAIAAMVETTYGGSRYRWRGEVDRAEALVDPQTRTIDVVIRVPEPTAGERVEVAAGDALTRRRIVPDTPPLLVGELVRVAIDGADLGRYVVVPRTALRPGGRVWVVRDGTLAIVGVEVVQRIDELAYLLASGDEDRGIADGDAVVVSELAVATPGMRVRIAEPSAGAS